ncbi:MAG: hypothetical protein Tsb0019_10040 [Roseibium sp.]
MNEITDRRVRHLKRLEASHNRDFWARFGNQFDPAGAQAANLSDALSADWNGKQPTRQRAVSSGDPERAGKPLPAGWRNEHWKTQQAMAADYAGVEAGTKAEAVSALDAYEQSSDVREST